MTHWRCCTGSRGPTLQRGRAQRRARGSAHRRPGPSPRPCTPTSTGPGPTRPRPTSARSPPAPRPTTSAPASPGCHERSTSSRSGATGAIRSLQAVDGPCRAAGIWVEPTYVGAPCSSPARCFLVVALVVGLTGPGSASSAGSTRPSRSSRPGGASLAADPGRSFADQRRKLAAAGVYGKALERDLVDERGRHPHRCGLEAGQGGTRAFAGDARLADSTERRRRAVPQRGPARARRHAHPEHHRGDRVPAAVAPACRARSRRPENVRRCSRTTSRTPTCSAPEASTSRTRPTGRWFGAGGARLRPEPLGARREHARQHPAVGLAGSVWAPTVCRAPTGPCSSTRSARPRREGSA